MLSLFHQLLELQLILTAQLPLKSATNNQVTIILEKALPNT